MHDNLFHVPQQGGQGLAVWHQILLIDEGLDTEDIYRTVTRYQHTCESVKQSVVLKYKLNPSLLHVDHVSTYAVHSCHCFHSIVIQEGIETNNCPIALCNSTQQGASHTLAISAYYAMNGTTFCSCGGQSKTVPSPQALKQPCRRDLALHINHMANLELRASYLGCDCTGIEFENRLGCSLLFTRLQKETKCLKLWTTLVLLYKSSTQVYKPWGKSFMNNLCVDHTSFRTRKHELQACPWLVRSPIFSKSSRQTRFPQYKNPVLFQHEQAMKEHA